MILPNVFRTVFVFPVIDTASCIRHRRGHTKARVVRYNTMPPRIILDVLRAIRWRTGGALHSLPKAGPCAWDSAATNLRRQGRQPCSKAGTSKAW